MPRIELVILGDPKAQGRHRTYTKGRGGRVLPYPIQVDPSKKDKANLRTVVQEQAPEQPLNEPLSVKLLFYFPYRSGDYGTGRNAGILKKSAPIFHTVRPDCDNCIKLILDALNGVFWRDDALISVLTAIKRYDQKPRTEIVIETLNNEDSRTEQPLPMR